MIRKKSVTQTPSRDSAEGSTTSSTPNGASSTNPSRSTGTSSAGSGSGRHDNRSSLVGKALDDLRLFLERKGVDPSRADEFEIHIKQKNAVDGSYSVHYTDPLGSMLSSKNDVLLAIQQSPSGSKRHASSHASSSRSSEGGGSSREQRNQLREQMRGMDPAEVKKLAQATREQEEKLREERRKTEQAERERERERREAEKEREKEKREQSRKEQKTQRFQEAEKAKVAQKERSRKDDKARQQLRRDVAAEQKKTRTAAACAVLEQFDIEEDMIEMQEALAAPHLANRVFEDAGADKDAAAVASFLSRIGDGFEKHGISPSDVENILDIATCLHAHQGLLKLPNKVFKLDNFLSFLEALSFVAPRASSVDDLPADEKADPKVVKSEDTEPAIEAEVLNAAKQEKECDGSTPMDVVEETTPVTEKPLESRPSNEGSTQVKALQQSSDFELWRRLQDAEVDLDRVQLHMLRPVLSELHNVLGVREPGVEEPSTSKKDSKRSVVHHGSGLWTLPLNQLTWAELTRMCMLMRIGQELNKTDEEINYIIKGGKPPFFRSTKNVMRALRYKMLVKKRIESLGDDRDRFMAQFVSPQLSMDEKPDAAIDGFDELEKAMLMATPEYGSNPSIGDDDDVVSSDVLVDAKSRFGLSFNVGNVELDFSSENELLASVAFASRGIEGHLHLAEIEATKTSQEAAALSASQASENGSETAASKPPVLAKAPAARVVNYLPGLYRRCCKVWAKIANMSAAKNFFWEVDRDVYPEYYDVVKKPIALSAIAYKLSTMAYGSVAKNHAMGETESDVAYRIGKALYRDFRLIYINCVTFNSEITPLVYQAQKVIQAAQRHIQKWVLFPKRVNDSAPLRRPAIWECDEQHCLHSFDVIQSSRSLNADQVRCGRCSGVYSVLGLETTFSSHDEDKETDGMEVSEPAQEEQAASSTFDEVFYVGPTPEVINTQSEEWVCMQCLKDEFAVDVATPSERCHYSPFVLNEWGCSTYMPWLLNGATSSLGSDLSRVKEINGNCGFAPSAHVRQIGENVLCTESTTVKAKGENHVGGLPVQVLLLESAAAVICDNQKSPILPQNENGSQPYLNLLLTDKSSGVFLNGWTISDRLCVLRGLCELLRLDPSANSYATALHHECKKLAKVAGQPVGQSSLAIEGSFLALCRTIAGEEAIPLVKRRLEGIEGSGGDAWLEEQFQNNAVMAGRCLACKGSTFEDDCTTPDMLVLLCDGCNVEAHLKCLGMDSVPSGEWFCDSCAQRLANRGDDAPDSPFALVQQINQHRSMDDEARLLNEMLDRLEKNRGLTHEDDGTPLGTCAHCGMTELELTSPFVVGQSREEFDAYVELFDGSPKIDGVLGQAKGTSIDFSFLCQEIEAPSIEIPEFPLLDDKNASKLLGSKLKKSTQANCPIVHQICALNMFCNRIARQTHATRRVRRSIADQVINLSGIATFPIGIDDSGFSYWKLPVSEDLFICNASQVEPWKDMLRFGKNSKERSKSVVGAIDLHSFFSGKRWIRISDIDAISKLVFTCLSDSSPNERTLRRSISSIFLTADRVKEFQQKEEAALAAAAAVAPASDAAEGDENVSEDSDSGEDDNASESDKENDLVESAQDENGVVDEAEIERKSKRGKATKLMLVKKKGVDVPKRSIINQEIVFDDSDICWTKDDEDEESSYAEYFQFSKTGRYYAVAFIDDFGVRVRNPRPGTTVINQVHRDGILQPLAYTPLKEPWTDGIYYFSSLSFKRSGNYTISFTVEGPGSAEIKPLVFSFSVEARNMLRGAPNTYARLNAKNYAHSQDRQITWGRREVNAALCDLRNELCVVRSALFTVYAALPSGALVMGPDSEDSPTSTDEAESLAEPEGWNRVLDRCWRNMVFQASTAQEMMECVLMLEYYVARQWLDGSSSHSSGSSRPPMLSALPGAHSAVRCATLSAAALRIFVLDRILIYDKVQHVKRGSRLVGGDNKPAASVSTYAAKTSSGSGTSSRPKVQEKPVPAARTTKNSGHQPTADSGRLHRASFESASKRMSSSRSGTRDSLPRDGDSGSESSAYDDDDSRSGRRPSDRKRKNTPKGDEWASYRNVVVSHQQSWTCQTCGVENEARARTCSCCEERKPAASLTGVEEPVTPKLSRGERMKKRQRYDDDSFDDEPEPVAASRSTTKKRAKAEVVELANIDELITQLLPMLPVDDAPEKPKEILVSHADNTAPIPEETAPDAAVVESEHTSIEQPLDATDAVSSSAPVANSLGDGSTAPASSMEIEAVNENESTSAPDASEPKKINNVVDLSIRMLSILRRLQNDATSLPFWFPVPHDMYPDYRVRVREPMDLGTIAERVRSLNYYGADIDLFDRDVSLVWSNCYTYNLEGSGIYENAKVLEKEYRRLLEAWIRDESLRPQNPDII